MNDTHYSTMVMFHLINVVVYLRVCARIRTYSYITKKMPKPSSYPPVHNHGRLGGFFSYFRSHDVIAQRVKGSSNDSGFVIKEFPPLADASRRGLQEDSLEGL